ncbi:opacity protein-like surface antigen [Prosthecobacter fusiformis]|uniref:Opacity protein-like surface antigen n=2 Tax=Prosthecobacter fusiformis TaxID=48464 RepID=A0A4R7RJF8_9BACT|nr:opacity protein-like surface antigen [Prosthecobacter fusiformis]
MASYTCMKTLLLLTLLATATTAAFAKEPPTTLLPWQQNSIDLEAGYLWKVGGDTPLDYEIAPVILSWRPAYQLHHVFNDGSALVVRSRFAAIGQAIIEGPENHYLGFMAAPSLEFWDPTGTWSIYGQLGGGFGWIDSQGVAGGQGQDLTYNWFAAAGVSYAITETMSLRAGAMFQHLSNLGATDPNPGLNSLGFTLGVSWGF